MADSQDNVSEPQVSETQTLQQVLAHREGFEEVFKRISNALITLPLDTLESWVQNSLQEIGTFLGVDRVYVFLFDDTGEAIGSVFEWCEKGVEYHPHEQLIGVTVDNFPWSMSHWTRGENVYVGDPDELPDEAAPERGACEAFTIKSYINVPLFAAGALHGWAGLDSVEHKNVTWPQVDITMLKWVGESIINTLFRRSRERLLLERQQRLEQEIFRRKQVETELVRAKARVQEANRLKSVILANLSHELQTPLNVVVGYADMLGLMLTDEGQREMLNALIQGAVRMSNTVSSVLSLSELESQLLRLELQSTDVQACVQQVVDDYLPRAREQGLDLSWDGLPDVLAALDPGMAAACIGNIVDNAIKYTDHGAVSIKWGADTDGSTVFVRIQDTGVGIAAEQLQFIFDEFRQGSEGDTRDYEGVGLGLALAKKMVALMKGSIEVDSEMGNGTVFTLRFMTPTAHEAAQAAAAALEADAQPQVLS